MNWKQGLPFFSYLGIGLCTAMSVQSYRYEFPKQHTLSHEELQKLGLKPTKSTTIEEEYEKLKDLDIDNWENIRIPRPWEESPKK